jgi:starch synthase
MNVLLLTAECAPYAKVGGLGDVSAALPVALRELGHDVRVIMPRYGTIDPQRWSLEPATEPYRFPAGHETITASLSTTENQGVPTYFVEIPWLFGDRFSMYDHGDDARRFVLFCGAALAGMEALGWKPDVLHANDWHTAPVPAMLRGGRAGAFYLDAGSVFTIHNLAYQGWSEPWLLDGAAALLPQWVRDPWVNLLSLAVQTADVITTVSPTYAQEILTPPFGEGLDGLLRSRQDRLFGVLNGIDTELYDPAGDPRIAAPYTADDLSGKSACKAALQAEAGFAAEPGAPVLAMVSRLVDQKGFDLVAAALEPLLGETRLQVVILGTGHQQYHALLEQLAVRYPGRLRAWLKFDAELAHRIYAGSDLFVMPSRFEPCGLGQMIAMRYGTVPVVRATGGLADTVQEGPPGDPRTGFVFWEYRVDALLGAVRRALTTYEGAPDEWAAIRENGMRADLSWELSARRYLELYELAVSSA